MLFKHYLYNQPMYLVFLETAAMLILWTAAMLVLPQKAKKAAAVAGVGCAAALILFFTVFGREPGENRGVYLLPFISFKIAEEKPYYYRTMYMNVLLFIPLGLSLPFALPEKLRLKPLLTVGTAAVVSGLIEVYQYVLDAGICEVDDIIMNTIGALVGTSAFLICTVAGRQGKGRGR